MVCPREYIKPTEQAPLIKLKQYPHGTRLQSKGAELALFSLSYEDMIHTYDNLTNLLAKKEL